MSTTNQLQHYRSDPDARFRRALVCYGFGQPLTELPGSEKQVSGQRKSPSRFASPSHSKPKDLDAGVTSVTHRTSIQELVNKWRCASVRIFRKVNELLGSVGQSRLATSVGTRPSHASRSRTPHCRADRPPNRTALMASTCPSRGYGSLSLGDAHPSTHEAFT